MLLSQMKSNVSSRAESSSVDEDADKEDKSSTKVKEEEDDEDSAKEDMSSTKVKIEEDDEDSAKEDKSSTKVKIEEDDEDEEQQGSKHLTNRQLFSDMPLLLCILSNYLFLSLKTTMIRK